MAESSEEGSQGPEPSSKRIKKKSSYTRRERIVLLVTLTGQFFVNACVSLPAPFLPQIDETHGLSSDYTGWLLGISPLIQLLLSPFMGKFIPRVGLHTTFVFGFFFAGGATVLFGSLEYLPVLNQSSPEVEYCVLAFIIRSVQSVGQMAFATAALTLLSTAFPGTTSAVMSYSETAIGVGIMCGPAMGSAFYAVGGFAGTFTGVGVIMMILSVIMYFVLPIDIGERSDQGAPISVRAILSDVNLVFSLMMATFSAAIWASIDPILEPELRNKYGLTQELSALCFLLLSVTYSLTSPIIGKLLDRFSKLDPFYVGAIGYIISCLNFLIMGPCPLLPWLQRPLWLLLIGIGVMGLSLGLTIVPSLTIIFGNESDHEDAEKRNTSTTALISGFYFSAVSFGDFFGPTFSGTVTKESSFAWTMTYYSFGSVAIVVAIAMLKIYRSIKKCHRKDTSYNRTTEPPDHHHAVVNHDERQPLLA